MTVTQIRTHLTELDASRRRTEALADLRHLLRQAMAAAQAAASGTPDRDRLDVLGQVHAGLADLLRALPGEAGPK